MYSCDASFRLLFFNRPLIVNPCDIYWIRSRYCATVGKRCVGAWEESADTCGVEDTGTCDRLIGYEGTSDAICE